ncbi:MAG: SpoIVB peptidase [Christensenellales bacterium]
MRKIKWFGIIIVLILLAVNFTPQVQYIRNLPDQVSIQSGNIEDVKLDLPFFALASYGSMQASAGQDERLKDVAPDSQPEEQGEIEISVLGIPVKTITVSRNDNRMIIAGGHSVGVALYTKGALIVGVTDIVDETGKTRNPAKEAGLQAGDIIEAADGQTIQDARHLTQIIDSLNGKALSLLVMSQGEKKHTTIQPVKDSSNHYKLGMWVRDSTAGVGTLTFYDPVTRKYACLGHPITDIDTQEILTVKEGELLRSEIYDVRQGMAGEPGELIGAFPSVSDTLGSIEKNCEFGVYGEMYRDMRNTLYPELMEVATQSDVKLGKATLLTTIDSTGIQEFECEITRVSNQSQASAKGMVVKITDDRLLSVTGGIVQGMSGSPLIQRDKLIGAITHVFVSDPTQGYGMHIEWMLQQTDE